MKKPPSKPPTRAALAAALGVSPARINQLKNDHGMPTRTIAAAQKWREAQGQKQSAKTDSAEELRLRRIALLKQQERRTRIDADERGKLLISVGEVEDRDSRIGHAVRAALVVLEHILPGRLAGMSENQIASILHEVIHQILTDLADEQSTLWTSFPTTKPPST